MTAAFNLYSTALPRLSPTASDDALLAAIAAGDRAAVGLLYTRHADALRAAAVSALPAHEEPFADDIVQNVFLSLLEGRAGAFQPARGKALAWLKGIARREAAVHSPPPTVTRGKRGAS